MSFTSSESGTLEIHVRAFPDGASGGNWKVSSGGGVRSRWSGDGRTIFYQSAQGTAISGTKVTPGMPFGVGATDTVLKDRTYGAAWDLDRATGRMAVTETVADATVRVVVMQHWLDALRRKQAERP